MGALPKLQQSYMRCGRLTLHSRSHNFQMSNETFRTPPPKKKKAVKVLGDFLGVVEMFVYLSPFGSLSPTFSLSQDFLLSRLQELIEILGEAGLAI